ncbi:hypothetical protein PUN28_008104 [Cardiocondyla obscurior]|uniref:Uncharacterized protein n=1 Tax=Cardiocondyla obscurior TaxID=286306 RepID=A0AAW2FYA9_9HYME
MIMYNAVCENTCEPRYRECTSPRDMYFGPTRISLPLPRINLGRRSDPVSALINYAKRLHLIMPIMS